MNAASIPGPIRSKLDRFLPQWEAQGRKAVFYAAGALTRLLVEGHHLGTLMVLGIIDKDPGLQGKSLGPHRIHPIEDLMEMAPDLIVVASSMYHREICRELLERFGDRGPEIFDLCEDQPPLAAYLWAMSGLAERHGLRLERSGEDVVRIIRPGHPRKVIELQLRSAGFAPGIITLFEDLLSSYEPDQKSEGEILLRINQPRYRAFPKAGISLFSPAQTDNESNLEHLLAAARLKPGESVVDVGAYAGDTTYFFSRAVGAEGRVLAIEPDPESFAALQRNLAEHQLANVTAASTAVWDKQGEMAFSAGGTTISGITLQPEPWETIVRVPTQTLEAILDEYGFQHVDFLKMDIEGAEFTVLPQAMEVLRRLRPRMILEIHGQKEGPDTLARGLALLSEIGFHVSILEDRSEQALVSADWPRG